MLNGHTVSLHFLIHIHNHYSTAFWLYLVIRLTFKIVMTFRLGFVVQWGCLFHLFKHCVWFMGQINRSLIFYRHRHLRRAMPSFRDTSQVLTYSRVSAPLPADVSGFLQSHCFSALWQVVFPWAAVWLAFWSSFVGLFVFDLGLYIVDLEEVVSYTQVPVRRYGNSLWTVQLLY